MERSDWILLVAGLGDGDPLTPVQLQKSLFLLGEMLPAVKAVKQEGNFYEFQPYNYGPFCAEIYSDAERLQDNGEMRITLSSAGGWREYAATPKGRKTARELAVLLPEGAADYIVELVKWVRSLTFNELVSSIYQRWPQYKANSVFAGQTQ